MQKFSVAGGSAPDQACPPPAGGFGGRFRRPWVPVHMSNFRGLQRPTVLGSSFSTIINVIITFLIITDA